MADPDPAAYRITEIRRHVADLLALADRLAHPGPSSPTPSPALVRLYAEVARLAATLQESPPHGGRTGVRVPQQTEPGPRAATAPRRRSGVLSGPAPSATDYWFG